MFIIIVWSSSPDLLDHVEDGGDPVEIAVEGGPQGDDVRRLHPYHEPPVQGLDLDLGSL